MPPPRSRRASPASAALLHHLDRVHRALLEARPAAGTTVVVEPVAVPDAELDHRVLRARPEAAVALEAVPARQAPPRLVARLLDRQTAEYLGEVGDPLVGRELGLVAARRVAEIPEMQQVERRRLVLRRTRRRRAP